MMSQPIFLFWFRRDLRLEDNAGLYHALKNNDRVVPVFIFDPDILEKLEDKRDRRVDFIHQALLNIQNQLGAAGSTLFVFHGRPAEMMVHLANRFDAAAVYCNHDYEPEAMKRDCEVSRLLTQKGIAFHTSKDQVVFEKEEVSKPDGKPYTVFTPYSRVWKKRYAETERGYHPTESFRRNYWKGPPAEMLSLADIGFEKSDLDFHPPEVNIGILKNYHNTRNIPSVNGTSRLSAHLRFGTVSVRKLVAAAAGMNEQWLNELIWREFFMSILFHFPYVADHPFRRKYEAIPWRNNEEEFERWCSGQTGYPIVDAGMRELNETGFMHNRVRMIVASFLTRHLLIDWRWGEAYFARKLLDFELSSNNGNWQWAAGCGCDAAPYFRIFNPSEQARRFDPESIYIKKWVPEVHMADYPAPMVDHASARARALAVYRKAVGALS